MANVPGYKRAERSNSATTITVATPTIAGNRAEPTGAARASSTTSHGGTAASPTAAPCPASTRPTRTPTATATAVPSSYAETSEMCTHVHALGRTTSHAPSALATASTGRIRAPVGDTSGR